MARGCSVTTAVSYLDSSERPSRETEREVACSARGARRRKTGGAGVRYLDSVPILLGRKPDRDAERHDEHDAEHQEGVVRDLTAYVAEVSGEENADEKDGEHRRLQTH